MIRRPTRTRQTVRVGLNVYMFAFSTCWNQHRHTDGRAMVNEVRALGFEHAELSHGVRLTLIEGVREAVRAGEIRICSLHNFCPLPPGVRGAAPDVYSPASVREAERALAVRHTLQTLEYAAHMGAKVVVVHLGRVRMRDYTSRLLKLSRDGRMETARFCRLSDRALRVRERRRNRFLDQVFRSLDTIVPRALALGIKLGLETRYALEEIPDEQEIEQILTRYGSDGIGYWHDVGHTQVKENVGLMSHEVVLERFRGRTLGMHLQDVAPPGADHQPPGRGTFHFERLCRFVTDNMVLAWEIHPDWKAGEIVDEMKRVQELLYQPATT